MTVGELIAALANEASDRDPAFMTMEIDYLDVSCNEATVYSVDGSTSITVYKG